MVIESFDLMNAQVNEEWFDLKVNASNHSTSLIP